MKQSTKTSSTALVTAKSIAVRSKKALERSAETARLRLRLTPHGELLAEAANDGSEIPEVLGRRLCEMSAQGSGALLLHLGAGNLEQALPASFQWWRAFTARYITALCRHVPQDEQDAKSLTIIAVPDDDQLIELVRSAPMMIGAEYLTIDVLQSLWKKLADAFATAFAQSGQDLQTYIHSLSPVWNFVGRVYFNLAENRRDADAPFAFLATYTMRLTAQAKPQHVPLEQALREYAGAAQHEKLLSLLLPVQRASLTCPWLAEMVERGEIFHPLRWTPKQAATFLASATALENAGILVRMPATWRAHRPARPKVQVKIGNTIPTNFGLDSLLDFSVDMTLDGETLNQAEIEALLAGTSGLVLLRGQWVEVDRDRLAHTMEHFRAAQALARREGMPFAEAMRIIAGADIGEDEEQQRSLAPWSEISAGPWLANILQTLRAPDGADIDPGPALHATLRPYQKAGVQWLHVLSGLGLGACLADDMGLGKTIQVLSLLLVQKQIGHNTTLSANLLVAPASLLANWATEIEKFAPSLKARIVHSMAIASQDMKQLSVGDFDGYDLVITSYSTLQRIPALREKEWRFLILDEAQAIKNPKAQQTKCVKALHARARIALTGTPVENQLTDLWSIFDCINPGLLGTTRQFGQYLKRLTKAEENPYGPLRELVQPYILRRMKTDRSIIADLPDKTEVKAYCSLSKKQAALYEETVDQLIQTLKESDGIERKGVILGTLMRLKQICNHPSQWLSDGLWQESESGKFARLREIAEVVLARQEKMLLFTQFREMTGPLHVFLEGIFGQRGLVLDGTTAIKQRRELVRSFQEDEDVPFFILSLKAGGSGLTLTAASHVVHFDRWWNPAVENQATDRAFRIGQKQNVLVHKFVCRGTIEEKIDTMIEDKKSLTEALLGETQEMNLTTMPDDALLRLIRLDINAVMKDGA